MLLDFITFQFPRYSIAEWIGCDIPVIVVSAGDQVGTSGLIRPLSASQPVRPLVKRCDNGLYSS